MVLAFDVGRESPPASLATLRFPTATRTGGLHEAEASKACGRIVTSGSASALAEFSAPDTSLSGGISFSSPVEFGAPVGLVVAAPAVFVGMTGGLHNVVPVGAVLGTGALALRGTASVTVPLGRGNSDQNAVSSCEQNGNGY